MLKDVHSNVAHLVGHIAASRNGASLVGSTIVNVGDYVNGQVQFLLNVGALSGTLAAKLQYSSSSTFGSDVNDDDGSTGNTTALASATQNTAYRFEVKMPKDETKPYYRLACTDASAAVVYGSTIIGMLKKTPVSYS